MTTLRSLRGLGKSNQDYEASEVSDYRGYINSEISSWIRECRTRKTVRVIEWLDPV